MHREPGTNPTPTTRRDFLRDAVFGLHAVAVADLLARDGLLLAAPPEEASCGGLHFEARARQVIHIFLGGGLSHV